jgi:Carboxypeptidase regulatory-like domain
LPTVVEISIQLRTMKRITSTSLFAAVAVVFMLSVTSRSNADVCVYRKPKVQRICGSIVDPDGQPITRVTVVVLKSGTAQHTVTTDDAGQFDFDSVEAGEYKLEATMPGFQPVRYSLTLSKPIKTCRHALEVQMTPGGIHCQAELRQTKKPLSRKR